MQMQQAWQIEGVKQQKWETAAHIDNAVTYLLINPCCESVAQKFWLTL